MERIIFERFSSIVTINLIFTWITFGAKHQILTNHQKMFWSKKEQEIKKQTTGTQVKKQICTYICKKLINIDANKEKNRYDTSQYNEVIIELNMGFALNYSKEKQQHGLHYQMNLLIFHNCSIWKRLPNSTIHYLDSCPSWSVNFWQNNRTANCPDKIALKWQEKHMPWWQ